MTVFIGVAARGDGVAALGQYKYPRRIPRGEVMLHVIRFSDGRDATVLETWYCLETRCGCHSSRACHLERHLHRLIVSCREFSGEDAEKSSTATDQGGRSSFSQVGMIQRVADPLQTPSPGLASASGTKCNSLWSHRLQPILVSGLSAQCLSVTVHGDAATAYIASHGSPPLRLRSISPLPLSASVTTHHVYR